MKKKICISLCLVFTFSCASVSELKEAKSCKVWEEQPVIGPFGVDANPKFSYWKGKCAILGLFLCHWVKTDMTGNEVFQETNGIFSSRTKIATLSSESVTYNQTFLSKVFDIKPIKIDMDRKVASFKVDLPNPVGGKLKGERTINFNNACTVKEVAMGTLTLITAKNKLD